MHTTMWWLSVGFALVSVTFAQPVQQQPSTLFANIGLTAQQVAAVDAGRPVAKVLSWGVSSEVYVFGAVYIDGSPAAYLKAARDIGRLAGSPGYLGVGELPSTATGEALSALTLEPDDIKALKSCREGSCDVQLPTTAIQTFKNGVNWSQPDVPGQVNGLARGMVLQLVREYRRGGNNALGVYRDKEHPARVTEQFETMVSRSATLPNMLPELRRYLLQYPDVDLPGADVVFYWEKVNFGLKPTVRVNHAVIYRGGGQSGEIDVVAIKQLYASHYFHTALDVSVCVRDDAHPGRRGFYLITLKGSEQDGLTGFKGSMVRKVVVNKTVSSLEAALLAIKKTVEGSAPPARP
jgi:hypothetical protein